MAILTDISYKGFSLGNTYINLNSYQVRRVARSFVERIDEVNTRIEKKVYLVSATFNIYSNTVENTLSGDPLDRTFINYETENLEEIGIETIWLKLKEQYGGVDV